MGIQIGLMHSNMSLHINANLHLLSQGAQIEFHWFILYTSHSQRLII